MPTTDCQKPMDNSRIPNAIHGLGFLVLNAEELLLWLYDNTEATVPELIEALEEGFDPKFLRELTFKIPKEN